MILAMPIGSDLLSWNRNRIYGRIRFSLLIQGWKVIDTFGFNPEEFHCILGDIAYQPVFYLAPEN